MDNLLGWENPSIVPSFWSNQYDNFSESDTDYCDVSGGKTELGGALFGPQGGPVGLDRFDEMVEMLTSPNLDHPSSFNALDHLDDLLARQGLPVLAENLITSQELPVFGNDMSGGGGKDVQNLSSSGNFSSSGESEASSRGDRSKIRPNLKRKFGDSPLQSSTRQGGGFQIFFERSSPPATKRMKSTEKEITYCSSIDFRQDGGRYEPDTEAIAQVKEMIYRAAALRPVSLVLEEGAAEKPKRKNVRISSDPQTVAARHRRERISDRLRVLQRLVPGGSKMDTASMLDEAASYLKFLKSQVSALEGLGTSSSTNNTSNSIFPTTVLQPFSSSCNNNNLQVFSMQALSTKNNPSSFS